MYIRPREVPHFTRVRNNDRQRLGLQRAYLAIRLRCNWDKDQCSTIREKIFTCFSRLESHAVAARDLW